MTLVAGDGIARDTTLGAVAMHCSHSPDSNLKKYREFIEEAAERRVDFLVFPEVSLQGYVMGYPVPDSATWHEQLRYFRSVAETVPGPATDILQGYAQRYNMLIQAGMAESAMDGNITYNSAVLIGPRGVIGVHRKLYTQYEWPIFRQGNDLAVHATHIGKIGMLICYDLCFPETVRSIALQGAVIASMTTAWPMQSEDPDSDYSGYAFDILSRANALSNQIWMVCANQVGRPPMDGCPDYFGHSRIIAPSGKVRAEIGHQEGLVTATVDISGGIEGGRTSDFFGLNMLSDRRPELYGILADNSIYYRPDVRRQTDFIAEQQSAPPGTVTPELPTDGGHGNGTTSPRIGAIYEGVG
jgi:predicted amidohydrolase